MAALIHAATVKFGSNGTLDEKELCALWDAYDKDKNGVLDRDELRKLYIDMHKESVAKLKSGLWEMQKAMLIPGPLCCSNCCCCCMPCCQLQTSKSRLGADLQKAMPEISSDFTPKELARITKGGGGDWAAGNVVEALWSKGKDEWHPAIIKEVRADGTFTIEWSDGAPNDLVKTEEQIRPRFALGSFKELWIHLDENHDGKIDKGEFMRLAPRALRESFDGLIMQGSMSGLLGAGALPVAQTM